MNKEQWYVARDNRTTLYGVRPMNQDRRIVLCAEPEYAARYDGQVALITAANLLGRMSRQVALDVPDVSIVAPLPWAGRELRDFLLIHLHDSDPFGCFVLDQAQADDCVLNFGRTGEAMKVHGSGWNAYIGDDPSPLEP